ncbi:HAMP domain-containing methyl-accepting chemotaxis protein [Oscillospiraceae bacterium MB08-C2-2]|nr:HAMP domain-containing methyl-accepting chemotaxis protein [Oscillospiraceae bacterium MB08-C2-2]
MKNPTNTEKKKRKKKTGGFMKNLTIKSKLIAGFGTVLVLMLASTLLSFMSLNIIFSQVQRYQQDALPNTVRILTLDGYNVSLQRYAALIFDTSDKTQRKAYIDQITSEKENLDEILEEIRQYANVSDESLGKIDNIIQINNECQRQLLELANANTSVSDEKGKAFLIAEYVPNALKMGDVVNEISAAIDARMAALNQQANQAKQISAILLIGSLVVSFGFVIVVVTLVAKSIAIPVKEIEYVFGEMSKGNLHHQVTYEGQDELGRMASTIRSTNEMLVAYIQDIAEKLTLLSKGDMRFTVDLDYVGDFHEIKQAMVDTASALNQTMLAIKTSADQVGSGAEQVSSASQALASGATQQASTIEQLNSSISNVGQQANKNADTVKKASEYVAQANEGIKAGNDCMQNLNEAMQDISNSSVKISNITKVIEDIAFQTNILALNAAIEAARAGSAGRGFAVVADEVRNLAGKSAQAAKQTSELIDHSTVLVAEGEKLAAETSEILEQVAEKAKLIEQSTQEIEKASSQQVYAIEQITQGLSQVASVVQTNAATSEESSASSEELSAQAEMLRHEVDRFKLSGTKLAAMQVQPAPLFNDVSKESRISLAPGSKY